MPQVYDYPGVYVEEIPSGVRPIAGVSTSNTAFVGEFPRGTTASDDTDPEVAPVVTRPERVTSWDEFERRFGGLDAGYPETYAVRDYFAYGGSIAWICRAGDGGTAARKQFGSGANTVTIRAWSRGSWGKNLRLAVEHQDGGRFALTVEEYKEAASKTNPDADKLLRRETFQALSVDPADARFLDDVLQSESGLVRSRTVGSATRPGAGPEVLTAGGADVPDAGGADLTTALKRLDRIAPELFNLVCFPGNPGAVEVANAVAYCKERRAFLLLEVPANITPENAKTWVATNGAGSPHGAAYYPRLRKPDPLKKGVPSEQSALGAVAGIYAKTDAERGVWKAPAGTDAGLPGAEPVRNFTDAAQGTLNVNAVNVIRSFPVYGSVVWGARTLAGADSRASEWKYVPVRRTASYIEQSLYEGLKWVVFEPNDEPLWSQIRLNVGAFLNGMFRQGAFAGASPREAYMVRCDDKTTIQADVNRGIVNILVGFAPLKPAEFVVLKIQQMAGQVEA